MKTAVFITLWMYCFLSPGKGSQGREHSLLGTTYGNLSLLVEILLSMFNFTDWRHRKLCLKIFFKNFVFVLSIRAARNWNIFLCEIDQSFLVESERHLIFYTHCCLLSRQ